MIKIVAIDLDGTLFDPKKNISDANKKAIAEARAQGCRIVIATGRPLNGVNPVLQQLGIDSQRDYIIVYNGANVMNVKTRESIFSCLIDGKTVKGLYDESVRLGVDIHAFRENEQLITPKHNPYTDIEATINKLTDVITDFTTISDDDKFLKCMLVGCDEDISRCIKDVNPKYYNKFSMVRSSKIFLEFLNPKTDKGQALEALAKYLNIDMSETMAIGDAGNDISMIKRAGVGVAMENSFPEVLEIADFVTKSNINDGVAYAINKFVLGK